MIKSRKKAQEEMVGFALIIIIVAVILIVFLSISLRKSLRQEPIQSYEASSFIQSVLQYTTDCVIEYEPNYREIRNLIFDCIDRKTCLDERDACDALNSTLNEIIAESWKVGQDRPIKAYEFQIVSGNQEQWSIKQGNSSANYKGAIEGIGMGDTNVIFNVYY